MYGEAVERITGESRLRRLDMKTQYLLFIICVTLGHLINLLSLRFLICIQVGLISSQSCMCGQKQRLLTNFFSKCHVHSEL